MVLPHVQLNLPKPLKPFMGFHTVNICDGALPNIKCSNLLLSAYNFLCFPHTTHSIIIMWYRIYRKSN